MKQQSSKVSVSLESQQEEMNRHDNETAAVSEVSHFVKKDTVEMMREMWPAPEDEVAVKCHALSWSGSLTRGCAEKRASFLWEPHTKGLRADHLGDSLPRSSGKKFLYIGYASEIISK